MPLSTEQRQNIKTWIDAMRSGRFVHTVGPAPMKDIATTGRGCALQVLLHVLGISLDELPQKLYSTTGLVGTVVLDVLPHEINDKATSYEPVCVALEHYLWDTPS